MKPMAQDLLRIEKMEQERDEAWKAECEAYAKKREAEAIAEVCWVKVTTSKELDEAVMLALKSESQAAWKAEAIAIKDYHKAQCATQKIKGKIESFKSFLDL